MIQPLVGHKTGRREKLPRPFACVAYAVKVKTLDNHLPYIDGEEADRSRLTLHAEY
jgi:hypothetical protein